MNNPSSPQAARTVLLEALSVLGAWRDAITVVGGWVPDLLCPDCGHMGSLDADLALDTRKIAPAAYDTIKERLISAGYRPKAGLTHVFLREVATPNGPQIFTIKLDLVTGKQADHTHVHGMNLSPLAGLEFAFESHFFMRLEGILPSGARDAVQAQVASAAAMVVMKAIAMDERLKPKDAYDLVFCLKHWEPGIADIAAQLRPHLKHPAVARALGVLREKFASIDHRGPQEAGPLIAAQEGVDVVMARQDAFGRVAELLRAVDQDANA